MEASKYHFENYLVLFAILLMPILVLPSFVNAFVTPKLALITITIAIVLLIKSVRSIAKNSVSFSASHFDLPVFLLALAYLVSSILITPNKMDAYFSPGTATAVISGVLLFLILNQLPRDGKILLKYFLFASAAISSLVVLFASVGIFKNFGNGIPDYIKSTTFNTIGNPLDALVFLSAIIPLGLSMLLSEKKIAQKALLGVSLGIIFLGAAISLTNSLPGRDTSPRLPSLETSWFVTIDSLKQNPVFGVGPGNYLTAFNRFRPISYNATDLWATRFTISRSFLLGTTTEAGLAGLAAILIVAYFIFNLYRSKVKSSKNLLSEENGPLFSLLILGLSLLIFPASPVLLFSFFALLSLIVRTNTINLGLFKDSAEAPLAARLPVIIASLPVIIAVLFYGFYANKILSADITYKNALDLIAKNDGRGAYDTMQKAINKNPYVDRYRITYSQVNLALANSIAQKDGLTEEDRNTISQLIQQAIREGKVAVALNQTRAGNWENLGSIYRAVMPLAQGADAFAIQSYSQAVILDPLNVNTRIALGGIFYAVKAYEDAIDVFKLAVAVKQDHANARYNLAVAYRENGNLERAIAEMSTVLSLVNRDSEDYNVASKVLEDLKNKRASTLPESANLTPPSEAKPGLEPPLELPEDAKPPEPEVKEDNQPKDETTASPNPTPLP